MQASSGCIPVTSFLNHPHTTTIIQISMLADFAIFLSRVGDSVSYPWNLLVTVEVCKCLTTEYGDVVGMILSG